MTLRLNPTFRSWRARARFAALGLWVAGLAIGFRAIVVYELKAGPAANAPTRWTADGMLPFDGTHSNLVMFAQPKCPCTRASIAQLAVIMTQSRGKLHATVC